jgi:hypothetical protein
LEAVMVAGLENRAAEIHVLARHGFTPRRLRQTAQSSQFRPQIPLILQVANSQQFEN